MRGKNIGRKYSALFLLCGFLAGVCAGRWHAPEGVFAKENTQGKLPLIIYNDKNQKVCVREGAILPLSENLKVEIPVCEWEVGQEMLLEIRMIDGSGNARSNQVGVKRILLDNEEN